MSRRTRLIGIALRILTLVLLLGVWEWYGRQPMHIATPPPSRVFPALWTALREQDLLGLTVGTLGSVVVGFAVSIVFGLVVGFAIGVFPWAKDTLDPLVDALNAMPVTMLIPIVGVYTGLGFGGRVFVVFSYVAMIVVITTATGVREIDRGLVELARSYRVRGLAYYRTVLFPAALTHIAGGLSIGVSRAVRGAVTAELILVTANLGGFLVQQQAIFNNAALFAGILWTLAVGFLLYELALWAERRLTPWRVPAVVG